MPTSTTKPNKHLSSPSPSLPPSKPEQNQHQRVGRLYLSALIQKIIYLQTQSKCKCKQKQIKNVDGQQIKKEVTKTNNNQESVSQINNDLSSFDQSRSYVERIIRSKLGQEFISVLAEAWIKGNDVDWLVKDILEILKENGEGIRGQALVQQDQQSQQEQYSHFQCTSSVQFSSEQRSQPDKQLTQPFILQISQIRLKQSKNPQNKSPTFQPTPTINLSNHHHPNPYKFNPHPNIHLYLTNIPIYRSQINLLSQQLHQQKIIYHRQQQNNYYYIRAEYKLKCKLTNYQLFIFYGHGCNSLLKMACQHAAYEVLKQVYEMFPRVWRWFVMVKARKGLN